MEDVRDLGHDFDQRAAVEHGVQQILPRDQEERAHDIRHVRLRGQAHPHLVPAPALSARVSFQEAQPVEVRLGITDGLNTEVLSGLEEKARVIASVVDTEANAAPSSTGASNPFAPGGGQRQRRF